MRILVVSQYFWPENFRINDLVSAWIAHGHHVTILTGLPNYPLGKVFPEFYENPRKYDKYGEADVVRVPLISRGTSSFRLFLNYISFAISASIFGSWLLRRKKFDLIFVPQLSPITIGIPGIFLRKLKKIPLVLWVLDLWPESLEATGIIRSKSILKLVGSLVSLIYNNCDLILAQSRSFIPAIQKYCLPKQRVEYFPSWNDSALNFSISEHAPEIKKRPDLFNVMFTGNIGDAQDFPAILDAAEILKEFQNIRWLIVGEGRSAEWVRSEVAKRDLTDRFLLLGQFSLDRMPSFYRHADALLVSLKNEPIFSMTIPGKLQSYLASGVPILAMLNGEGSEIIASSGSGLSCPAGDGVGLAKIVLEMMSMNEVDRLEMGNRGRAYSMKEFDRTILMDRLLAWFNNLVKGREKSIGF